MVSTFSLQMFITTFSIAWSKFRSISSRIRISGLTARARSMPTIIFSPPAGFLLLQQVEQKHRMIEKLSDFFTDKRDQDKITHSLGALLKQRIFGICQSYEDLNDHEQLREDPLLQYICGWDDKTPVAGKSTLNRLELGHELDEKSPGMPGGLKSCSVNCFLRVSRSRRKP